MHHEPNQPSATEEDNRYDAAILALLLNPDLNAPLSVSEVAREIGDRPAVDDALARLNGAGLLHRCGEFVFSSAAARRFDAIGHATPSNSGRPEARPARSASPRYDEELEESF